FSQKIQFHETPSTIAPPSSGPSATARPPTPPQMPSARPRRCAGTADERMVSVSGVTIAPPTPCTARAMSSAVAVVESAAALEEELRPRLGIGLHLHGGEDVQEHPLREERRHVLGRQAGNALDVSDEVAEAVPHDLADLRVVAGGVGLHLRAQPGAVGEQHLHVRLADGVQGLLAATAL